MARHGTVWHDTTVPFLWPWMPAWRCRPPQSQSLMWTWAIFYEDWIDLNSPRLRGDCRSWRHLEQGPGRGSQEDPGERIYLEMGLAWTRGPFQAFRAKSLGLRTLDKTRYAMGLPCILDWEWTTWFHCFLWYHHPGNVFEQLGIICGTVVYPGKLPKHQPGPYMPWSDDWQSHPSSRHDFEAGCQSCSSVAPMQGWHAQTEKCHANAMHKACACNIYTEARMPWPKQCRLCVLPFNIKAWCSSEVISPCQCVQSIPEFAYWWHTVRTVSKRGVASLHHGLHDWGQTAHWEPVRFSRVGWRRRRRCPMDANRSRWDMMRTMGVFRTCVGTCVGRCMPWLTGASKWLLRFRGILTKWIMRGVSNEFMIHHLGKSNITKVFALLTLWSNPKNNVSYPLVTEPSCSNP